MTDSHEPQPRPRAEQDRVLVFDTTLRDGEQSPGASMGIADKLRVARALAELGVDVIEAGFPIASPGDFEAVRTVARQVRGPVIAGLARCEADDIDRAWEAVREAVSPRIHLFLATSAIHRQHKLRMAKRQIVDRTLEAVGHARELCDDVEFSPEDASRTEPEFLAEVVERAIEAGATTVNIPDTVGYAVPDEFGGLIRYLRRHVRGIDGVVISAHCHDDLGLAVANSLAAVQAGARQVECTINGIGERAGNCSLEELVMALRTREDALARWTGVDTRRLAPASRLVCNVTGLRVQRNKAVVGANAFAHEAGIHQHGMLRHHSTYEIMRPEDVGVDGTRLVLGKHSGRHALRQRLDELGFDLDDVQLQRVFVDFKRLADQKRELWDADLEALVTGAFERDRPWELRGFQTLAGTGVEHVAEVRLGHVDGRRVQDAACGDGPVDAVFKAIERLTGVAPVLEDYRARGVTRGEDAQGEVTVETTRAGRRLRGRGFSTDIIEASAHAYVDLINRVLAADGDAADAGDDAVSPGAASAAPTSEAVEPVASDAVEPVGRER